MTEPEFEAYRKHAERAHAEASERLTKQLMAELSREQGAWWREEKDKVRAELVALARKQREAASAVRQAVQQERASAAYERR